MVVQNTTQNIPKIFLRCDPATAWQLRQAMNAVGSGRFIGKGFLQGTQIRLRSLPALWTDFPFAVWAEEWGIHQSAVARLLIHASPALVGASA
jgi:cell division protein FtsW (lipid II flippase)